MDDLLKEVLMGVAHEDELPALVATRVPTFLTWLSRQAGRDDEVGLLARQARLAQSWGYSLPSRHAMERVIRERGNPVFLNYLQVAHEEWQRQ